MWREALEGISDLQHILGERILERTKCVHTQTGMRPSKALLFLVVPERSLLRSFLTNLPAAELKALNSILQLTSAQLVGCVTRQQLDDQGLPQPNGEGVFDEAREPISRAVDAGMSAASSVYNGLDTFRMDAGSLRDDLHEADVIVALDNIAELRAQGILLDAYLQQTGNGRYRSRDFIKRTMIDMLMHRCLIAPERPMNIDTFLRGFSADDRSIILQKLPLHRAADEAHLDWIGDTIEQMDGMMRRIYTSGPEYSHLHPEMRLRIGGVLMDNSIGDLREQITGSRDVPEEVHKQREAQRSEREEGLATLMARRISNFDATLDMLLNTRDMPQR